MGSRAWVVVLAEAEGLRWVLRERKMAWTEASARRAQRIQPGDRLILYVARGAFHNPTRDASQLIGLARVASPVRPLPRPLELAGRRFVVACDLDLEVAFPERAGVPVRPLVERLSFVRRKDAWGQYFRSGLLPVGEGDARVLERAVRAWARRLGSAGEEAGPSRLARECAKLDPAFEQALAEEGISRHPVSRHLVSRPR